MTSSPVAHRPTPFTAVTALALLMILAGIAHAQSTDIGGTYVPPATFTCRAGATGVFLPVRPEGMAELAGDVVLYCDGGATSLPQGAQIPVANITLTFGEPVTSRIMGNAGSASEALLLIDEPNAPPPVTGYGTTVPQAVCPTPLTGCTEFVGTIGGNVGVPVRGTSGAAATTPGWNVFQGVVSGNTITFYGIPILPLRPTDVNAAKRVYRITNLRLAAAALGGAPAGTVLNAYLSISPANAFAVTYLPGDGPALNMGSLGAPTTTWIGVPSTPPNLALGTYGNGVLGLRFTAGFLGAFKSRVAVGLNGNTSATAAVTTQNFPGQNYPLYFTESGFTVPITGGTSAITGLANFGTRLKAVFSNVPSGVSVYVSSINLADSTNSSTVAAETPNAALLTGETVADAADGTLSLATPTITTGNVPYAPLPVVNGTATAVWELTAPPRPFGVNTDFGVYFSFDKRENISFASLSAIAIRMSLGPNPTDGAFSAAQGLDPTSVNLVPRFADNSTLISAGSMTGCCAPTTVGIVGPVTSTYGQPVTLRAAVQTVGTPTVVPATGTVSITDVTTGATLLNPTAPSVTTITTSALQAGGHLLQATYSGGAGVSANGGSLTLTVNKAPLTITAPNITRLYGAANPPLTTTMTGLVNGETVATALSGSAGALSTTATSASLPGVYPITLAPGTLTPGANYTLTIANGTLTVLKLSTTVSLTLSGSTLTATVGTSGGGTPTGTVQFLNGASVIGVSALNGFSATITAQQGTLTAVYSGDAIFSGSASNALINASTASITLSSSANPSNLGQSITFTASISGSGPTPTGSVQFLDGGKPLGSSTVSGTQAVFTTSSLAGGVHNIAAQYSGDSSYSGVQATLSQTVLAAVTISVSASPAAPVFGQTVALTATVTGNAPAGFAAPTGQVTFQEAAAALFTPNTTLGSAPLVSGTATFSPKSLSVGPHTIIAAYSGDATWPSFARTLTVTVSQAPTTTSLSLSLNAAGLPVLTASVRPGGSGGSMPTGSVQFTDMAKSASLATAVLSSGNAATTTPAAALADPISAVYSGDANYQPSTSAPLPVAVNAAGNLTPALAPDEVASLFEVAGLTGDFQSTMPLTTTLGGVTVKITDSAGVTRSALLYGVFGSAGQINFVIPADTAPGTALVNITIPGGGTLTTVLTIAKSAAGIFTASMNGQGLFAGQVLHVHADTSQTITAGTAPVDFGPSTDQIFLVLYGTGMRHAASVAATVNGVTVPVLFFGAQGQYDGLDQLNLALPRSLAGAGVVTIQITVDGQPANPVTVSIQ